MAVVLPSRSLNGCLCRYAGAMGPNHLGAAVALWRALLAATFWGAPSDSGTSH